MMLEGVLGRPLDTFLLGSHLFMVTALGSCVKWPKSAVNFVRNEMESEESWGNPQQPKPEEHMLRILPFIVNLDSNARFQEILFYQQKLGHMKANLGQTLSLHCLNS
jgi:hypothetical protein